MTNEEAKQLVNTHGLRATKNRLDVLVFVETQKHPIGIDVLMNAFPAINEVTLYRMAADFVEKGIWHSYDLGHGHVDYETANRPHHHHAVCESCGTIEEVYGCKSECQLIKSVRGKSKQFRSLKSSSSTIFGTCHSCA